jgi:hypothetical protein
VNSAELAMRNDDFSNAMRDFAAAVRLKGDDPYLIQQYALTTYKSKRPTVAEALLKAKEIIHVLKPELTQDCETLGIAAAIHKRLWLIHRQEDDLLQAVAYYRRGFELCDNYHCGENYALCLNLQATIQKDINLLNFFNKQAKNVRETLMAALDKETAKPGFADRADKKWVLATLANTLFALGRTEEAHFYEGLLFMEKYEVFSQWERDTYEAEKLQLMKMLNSKSSKSYRYLQ